MTTTYKTIFWALTLLLLSVVFLPVPAFCEEKPIARLTEFSGTVLVNSRGSWETKPVKNLPLYSMDKLVTRIGTAIITFSDGAVIEIKNNSNLLIQQGEKEEGLIKKIKVVQRRLLLFMGKIFFKTGTGIGKVQTQFETQKTVIGIRGTAGVLSIGADGQVYIQFTEGHLKSGVGHFIMGKEAKDVPTGLADQNLLQKAAYMAFLAAEKCREAKEKVTRGEILPVQAEWVCAYAMEMSAKEAQSGAMALINENPSKEVVDWAEEVSKEANENIEKAKEAQQLYIDLGAVPEIFEYAPPGAKGEGYEEPEGEAERPVVERPSGPPLQNLDQNLELDDTKDNSPIK
jgi:hypothetical protein